MPKPFNLTSKPKLKPHIQTCTCGKEFETYNGLYCDECRPKMYNKHRQEKRQMHDSEEPKPIVPPKVQKMHKRCPRCAGYLQTRTGYPVPVEWSCFNCGMTSESAGYYDFNKGGWVDL